MLALILALILVLIFFVDIRVNLLCVCGACVRDLKLPEDIVPWHESYMFVKRYIMTLIVSHVLMHISIDLSLIIKHLPALSL